jgi:hypothetical protein
LIKSTGQVCEEALCDCASLRRFAGIFFFKII